MLQAIEAIIEKDGSVHPLENYHPLCRMRAIITLLEPMQINPQTKRSLNSFIGTLKSSTVFSSDPVLIQKELRDESD